MKYWSSLKNNLPRANLEFDRVIAHEFTHAVMDANILSEPVLNSMPRFVKEGLGELTIGAGSRQSTGNYSLKNLAANPSQLESLLNVNNTDALYSGSYMFLRYLARQAGDLTIENKTSDTTVKTFYGNDSIGSESDKTTIDSGAGNDEINVRAGSGVSINSGAGGDYVAVGSVAKKVTISSGAGNDFINNWGTHLNIKTAEGSDTVYNSNVAANSFIYTGAGDDSINNLSNSVKLSGDAGNDIITNDGGANVTMSGGSGNDILYGGDGKDVFIYKPGEGTDKIFDYSSGDMLKILNGKFSKSKFSGGTLSLTISGGGSVLFDNVTTSTNFNINGTSYKISGSKLAKK